MKWIVRPTEGEKEVETFYRYSHGGNEADDEYDTPEDAFNWGNAYADAHKRRWGYRYAVTVKKYVVSEMIQVEESDGS
jgi:hypothetical protein